MRAQSPNLMQGITYKACTVDGKYIALTFDDGPHPENSVALLEILGKHGAKATFFVMGSHAEKYPELLRRMKEEGHEIANHSWSHPKLLSRDFAEIRGELDRTSEAIFAATGEKPALFRPPFMDTSPTLENWIFKQTGMKTITAGVDSGDWKGQDAAATKEAVVSGATPGAIVLAHERKATAEALDGILAALKARGYQFVTVSELIAMDRTPTPAPVP